MEIVQICPTTEAKTFSDVFIIIIISIIIIIVVILFKLSGRFAHPAVTALVHA